jgi:hypothetical protein
VQPLERGLEILSGLPGLDHVGLTGDHLRVVGSEAHTEQSRSVQKEAMQSLLTGEGLRVEKIERGEPTLEDVFLSLAR